MARVSKKVTEVKISAMVDRLGALRATIADASIEEEKLRDTLLSLRRGTFTGKAYDATVSRSWSTRLDVKSLRKNVKESIWSPYEKRKRVVTLRVTSRVVRRRKRRAS